MGTGLRCCPGGLERTRATDDDATAGTTIRPMGARDRPTSDGVGGSTVSRGGAGQVTAPVATDDGTTPLTGAGTLAALVPGVTTSGHSARGTDRTPSTGGGVGPGGPRARVSPATPGVGERVRGRACGDRGPEVRVTDDPTSCRPMGRAGPKGAPPAVSLTRAGGLTTRATTGGPTTRSDGDGDGVGTGRPGVL